MSSRKRTFLLSGVALASAVFACSILVLRVSNNPALELDFYQTPRVDGCLYFVRYSDANPPEWVEDYWRWEMSNTSSAEGPKVWVYRQGSDMRAGMQVRVRMPLRSLRCM